MHKAFDLWAIKWRSKNRLDGATEYFLFDAGRPLLFRTRREARETAAKDIALIKKRPDLRREPFGWKTPQVVRVRVTITET